MNTFLWIIFILLIALGLIYLGGLIMMSIIIWCYTSDVDFWNRKIQPALKDAREWVDAGNKLRDYPADRLKKLDGKYDES